MMAFRGIRRLLSVYFALFFVAVAAAPHHHVNALHDLLLDQRSDSGDLVQPANPSDPAAGPIIGAARIVRDVPCAACFMGDFVCNSTASFQFVADLAPLPHEPRPRELARPALLPASSSTRAPPRAS
jgi:hypothetical protein